VVIIEKRKILIQIGIIYILIAYGLGLYTIFNVINEEKTAEINILSNMKYSDRYIVTTNDFQKYYIYDDNINVTTDNRYFIKYIIHNRQKIIKNAIKIE
jgi:hypothetical protein